MLWVPFSYFSCFGPLIFLAFLGINAHFLQQAGMSATHSFDLSMGQYAINTAGVLIAWFFMSMGIGRTSRITERCTTDWLRSGRCTSTVSGSSSIS